MPNENIKRILKYNKINLNKISKKEQYEILGLDQNATTDKIRAAYRKLAIQLHPDKNPNDKDDATEAFKVLQFAYDELINPKKQNEFDESNTNFWENNASTYGKNNNSSFSSHPPPRSKGR